MQEGCPDEYASRALTAKEENYAHIEKDELAICVAMERLHAYVYARHVAIEIDHKLLIAIANKSLASALRDNKESVSLATIQLRLDIYAGFKCGYGGFFESRIPTTQTRRDKHRIPQRNSRP